MLGRFQVPGCCPGAREGRPGPDCSGGDSMDPRKRKRAEAREFAAEVDEEVAELRRVSLHPVDEAEDDW